MAAQRRARVTALVETRYPASFRSRDAVVNVTSAFVRSSVDLPHSFDSTDVFGMALIRERFGLLYDQHAYLII